jgi:prepilin-type N-terminal cleavage/methylation domain-containing protein
MRKGYSLMEVLVTITILLMVMATLDRFFRVIVFDMPRDSRLVQENVVLLNAVKNIRSDVAKALALSQGPADANEPSWLVIQSADGEVRYKFENGVLVRKENAAADETTWSLPHGKIEMRVLSDKYKTGAVEVETGLEYWDNGKPRKRVANSYVFFAGLPGVATAKTGIPGGPASTDFTGTRITE